MEISWGRAMWRNFRPVARLVQTGTTCLLIVNPFIFLANPFIAGWLLVAEFIFTLAMALKCYPCCPAGYWPLKPLSSV